jgi:large subunit ribosomal protein L23
MKNPAQVILGHLVTEKSSAEKVNLRYVFKVALDANKIDIRQAVQKAFNVKVGKVNTINCQGKERRMRGKPGSTSNFKKAYVTLAPGQKIEKIDANV